MEQQQIDSVALDNGLTLELWDASRKVAADRWQVKLVARMRIDVSDRWFGRTLEPPAAIDQMRDRLGDVQFFEYHTERNFVDRNKKPAVLQNMRDSVMAKIDYYSHQEFAGRFLIRKFAAHQAYPKQT